MNHSEFKDVFLHQVALCENMLLNKAKEYADDDERLHNFKVVSELTGTSAIQALAGMMAKHTVSVYDMCVSNDKYSLEVWNEKITDHINYLILLKALVVEDLEGDIGKQLFDSLPETFRKR